MPSAARRTSLYVSCAVMIGQTRSRVFCLKKSKARGQLLLFIGRGRGQVLLLGKRKGQVLQLGQGRGKAC